MRKIVNREGGREGGRERKQEGKIRWSVSVSARRKDKCECVYASHTTAPHGKEKNHLKHRSI